jgi:ZIP Zinc transporter
VYVWYAAGFVVFYALEQLLHWHRCHRGGACEHVVGYLVLAADGLHNLIGGLAVGASFLLGTSVGVSAWVAAAAHEVPQELGDFGVLVHSGVGPAAGAAYNVVSALTFPAGALVAYWAAGTLDVTFLVPFAAGNFVYIKPGPPLGCPLVWSWRFFVGGGALLGHTDPTLVARRPWFAAQRPGVRGSGGAAWSALPRWARRVDTPIPEQR